MTNPLWILRRKVDALYYWKWSLHKLKQYFCCQVSNPHYIVVSAIYRILILTNSSFLLQHEGNFNNSILISNDTYQLFKWLLNTNEMLTGTLNSSKLTRTLILFPCHSGYSSSFDTWSSLDLAELDIKYAILAFERWILICPVVLGGVPCFSASVFHYLLEHKQHFSEPLITQGMEHAHVLDML